MSNVTRLGYCFSLFIFFFILPIYAAENKHSDMLKSWVQWDFDEAMKFEAYKNIIESDITKKIIKVDGKELYDFFKQLYIKNNPTTIELSEEPKIPKIIHQIWLGSPLPKVFEKYIKTWWEVHKGHGWKYILWTDEEVKNIKLYNQELFDKAENFASKADILRYEILYKMGGVYVDIDFQCLRPLDILNHTYDFYTGIQPLDGHFLQLNIALVGSVPKHPILRQCIIGMKDNWEKERGVPGRTGPIPFTRCFHAHAHEGDYVNVALPAFYFYPLECKGGYFLPEKWTQKGAFAVHLWAKSWMPIKYRRKEFQSIDNEESVQTWNK